MLGLSQQRKGEFKMDYDSYISEYRELINLDPDKVLETWLEVDGETMVRTVSDRLIAVAFVFGEEEWTMPPRLERFVI
jgi:uncharacterized Fe-S cluster-containing radical SAM superfamily enzyme